MSCADLHGLAMNSYLIDGLWEFRQGLGKNRQSLQRSLLLLDCQSGQVLALLALLAMDWPASVVIVCAKSSSVETNS